MLDAPAACPATHVVLPLVGLGIWLAFASRPMPALSDGSTILLAIVAVMVVLGSLMVLVKRPMGTAGVVATGIATLVILVLIFSYMPIVLLLLPLLFGVLGLFME